MRRLILVLICVMLSISATSAIYPETPATETFRWCGMQEIFFWNATSDVGAYHIMDHVPEKARESVIKVSVNLANSPRRVATFITPPMRPDAIGIAPGLWRFRTYHNVSSMVGLTTLEFKVYNRSKSGVETNLFYGHVISEDLNEQYMTEYLRSYARRNYTKIFPGDRLVITVDASTTSVVSRDVSMALGGNNHTSMVQINNFICSGLCCGSSTVPVSGNSNATPGFESLVAVIALSAVVLIYKNKK